MNFFHEIEQSVEQVPVTNTHSRTIAFGEILLLGGYVGTGAEHDGIANGAVGTLAINSNRKIQTPQVNDADLPVFGAPVYLAENTGAVPGVLQATGGTGTVYVGTCTKVSAAAGDYDAFIEFKPAPQDGLAVLAS